MRRWRSIPEVLQTRFLHDGFLTLPAETQLGIQALLLVQSRDQDLVLMRYAAAADPAAYFRLLADEQDVRRTCGLPPTYTVLKAACPGSGKLLDYDQFVHPARTESVSFASAAFYG